MMNNIEVGDIFFLHDKRWYNFVSTAIMICQTDWSKSIKGKMPYHTGVVYSVNDNGILLIDSTWGHGVRIVNLNDYVAKKHLMVWFKRLKDEYWPEDRAVSKRKLQLWLGRQVGKKYDKTQIIAIGWRSFLRVIPPLYRFIKKRSSFLDSRFQFICSEVVGRGFCEGIAVRLCPNTSFSTLTPHDINKSEKIH